MEHKLEELQRNIIELMEVHKQKDDTYMEIFAMCLKYLKNPTGSVAARQSLISALEQMIDTHKGADHVAN